MGLVRGEHHIDEQGYIWRLGVVNGDGVGVGHDDSGIAAVQLADTEDVIY
jgi:hypothetical protein